MILLCSIYSFQYIQIKTYNTEQILLTNEQLALFTELGRAVLYVYVKPISMLESGMFYTLVVRSEHALLIGRSVMKTLSRKHIRRTTKCCRVVDNIHLLNIEYAYVYRVCGYPECWISYWIK